MTKLVTTVACLQLVDRGVLSLDDATLVPKHLPELDAQKILTYTDEDKEVLTPRHSALTLRHLLTHTSGLAYPELNECVGRYAKEHGIASSFTMDTDISPFVVPLLFEPGTRWAYGPRIDWAGSLLERITGQKLSAYFDANIFAPLGITSLTFYPTPDINARELQLCGGDASGALVHAESMRTLDSAKIQIEIGGAGLVGTLRDYIHFLRGVLAFKSGAGGGLLSPESFALRFCSRTLSRPARTARAITTTSRRLSGHGSCMTGTRASVTGSASRSMSASPSLAGAPGRARGAVLPRRITGSILRPGLL